MGVRKHQPRKLFSYIYIWIYGHGRQQELGLAQSQCRHLSIYVLQGVCIGNNLQAAASAADLFDSMIRGIEISEAAGRDLQAKKPGSLKNRCQEARRPQESMPGGLEVCLACLAWHWYARWLAGRPGWLAWLGWLGWRAAGLWRPVAALRNRLEPL